jgi:putative methyltransferase (TIGR04325 family)
MFTSILCATRRLPLARWLFDRVAGYRRVFDTLAQANSVASRYISVGHASRENIQIQLARSKSPRPSDYPVLFHMDRMTSSALRVFDLGGNVGNLFYCYAQYLNFGPDLRWTVYDLPEVVEIGEKMAIERQEKRLIFTCDIERVRECDILLVSGSMHYFESTLPELLTAWHSRPAHIIVNRTPLADRKPVVTVQDAGKVLVACKIHDRRDLAAGLKAMDYQLVDQWPVLELSVVIPFYPELAVPEYSGFVFTRQGH